mmetsp:Transcript_6788/g.10473  ORF Transcript_6788/g.10473 Transcript_6788/m.10473 type:complete len:87 (-) Transcript_6788:92-352(-)
MLLKCVVTMKKHHGKQTPSADKKRPSSGLQTEYRDPRSKYRRNEPSRQRKPINHKVLSNPCDFEQQQMPANEISPPGESGGSWQEI